MNEDLSHLTREFRLAAEYRRCGWYVFLGMMLTLGVAGFLKQRGLVPPGNAGWIPFAIASFVLILLACGLLLAVYRWMLRVDETGLTRRRLWRWDAWRWDEFETGAIKRRGNGFVSTTRPWWRNELQFSFLDENDGAFVIEACKFFFQPAEEPPGLLLDGEVVLRYQVLNTVTFRRDGVVGRNGRGGFEFGWSEVKQVRLLYFDHWSDELCKIELDLPIRTLRIEGVNKITAQHFDAQRIANPKVIPEVVADLLRKQVPEDKLVRHALHGPPATLSECKYRRRKLQRELQNVTWCYRMMPAGCLILTSMCFVPKLLAFWGGPAVFPNAAWLLLAILLVVMTILSQPLMIWALLRDLRNRHGKSLRELDAWELESLMRTPAGTASSFRR